MSEIEFKKFYTLLNGFNDDQNVASVFAIGCGVMSPALMRRRKENRGISTELFDKLNSENINPIDWYQKAFEFIMIYAVCEQAIKEFMILQGNTDTFETETKLIHNLFDTLRERSLRQNFLDEMSVATDSIINSENELNAVWRFYTVYRHAIAHAGGRNTSKLKEKMQDVIEKNKKELTDVCEKMKYESRFDFEEGFFVSPFKNEIIDISDSYLNFFRNFALIIVESLERTIHPLEYEIKNFDPYKL